MKAFFYTALEQPLINLLFLLYVLVPGQDFGIAVILFTVLIRLILWPLMHKQLHSQKKIQSLQPELKKLNEKYKKDPVKQREALMELYREKEVNPGASCLLTLVQLPVLFMLFYVFKDFATTGYVELTNGAGILKDIYPSLQNLGFVKDFVATNTVVNTQFLGIVDLAKPSIPLAVIAGILQFIQSKMLMPKTQEKDAASNITRQMTYFMPIMITFFAISLPAVLPLYWIITTLFAILQQWIVMRQDVTEFEEGQVVSERDRARAKKKETRKKQDASKRK